MFESILYIILFLVFLSILIVIHELGHLTAAKIFKVYCQEFSIGMGPLLFKVKGKKAETQFSLRAIPFGGYVSMYGEGVELPDGVVIDQSRSLSSIKRWKRAIILVAGVTMNVVLALVLFFINNSCFYQENLYYNELNVAQSSIAYECGLRDGDIFNIKDTLTYENETFYLFDDKVTLNGDSSKNYAACLNLTDLSSFDDRDLKDFIYIYNLDDENKPDFTSCVFPNQTNPIEINSGFLHFDTLVYSEEQEKLIPGATYALPISSSEGKLNSFGCQFFYNKYKNSFPEALKATFNDFGEGSVVLFKSLWTMITDTSSWKDVGGIVAVGFETTSVLKQFGFGKFLFLWGLISVNLAVVNLLPFPGLDGWQLLVTIIEGITRKQIPEKIKNIVSFIGIGLLLLLMGVILIKDIATYFFLIV